MEMRVHEYLVKNKKHYLRRADKANKKPDECVYMIA